MVHRTCQACGAGFATTFPEDLRYCLDCVEQPVPTTAEVFGQVQILPTVYAVPLLTAPKIFVLPLDLVAKRQLVARKTV